MRIGIDLGGTNLAYGLVDAMGKLVDRGAYKVTSKDPHIIAGMMIDIYEKYVSDGYLIEKVGIGVPGLVQSKTGVVVQLVNLGWYRVPLATYLKAKITCPIMLGNDADAACIGETLFGAMVGSQNAVLLTLGTGVGSGVISSSKLLTGFNGAGTELGHMILDTRGVQCSCGNVGCFETFASASAIIRYYNQLDVTHLVTGAKEVFDRYHEGEPNAVKTIDWFIQYLSLGIINIYNAYAPEIIAIGGGLSMAFDSFSEKLEAAIAPHIFSNDIDYGKIVPARLGNDAGIIGAAFLDRY